MRGHDPRSEDAVISAGMLLGAAAVVRAADICQASDFLGRNRAAIWGAMVGLAATGDPDPIRLRSSLQDAGRLTPDADDDILAATSHPIGSDIERYAERVAALAEFRQTRERLQRCLAEAEVDVDPVEWVESVSARMQEPTRATQQAGTVMIGEAVNQAFDQLVTRAERGAGLLGLPSGFREYDEMTSGFCKGDVVVIAGQTSAGKSAFAGSCMLNAAKAGAKVVGFSLEMPVAQWATRFLANEANQSLFNLREAKVTNGGWTAMTEAANTLTALPIALCDDSTMTIRGIRREARRVAQQMGGLDMVVIDFLQLVQPEPGSKSHSRERDVAEISYACKDMAKSLDCCVIMLAQLNREAEKHARPPRRSDLRESAAIEHVADVIALLHQELEAPTPGDEKPPARKPYINLIIDKHRNGDTGNLKLNFAREYARFDDLQEVYQ